MRKFKLNKVASYTGVAMLSALMVGCGSSDDDDPMSPDIKPKDEIQTPHLSAEMSLDTDVVYTDSTYKIHTTFVNDGDTTLHNLVTNTGDALHFVNNTCQANLAVGESCVVTSLFHPANPDEQYDLVITANADETSAKAEKSVMSKAGQMKLEIVRDLPEQMLRNNAYDQHGYVFVQLTNDTDKPIQSIQVAVDRKATDFVKADVDDYECMNYTLEPHSQCMMRVELATDGPVNSEVQYKLDSLDNDGNTATVSSSTHLANTIVVNTDFDDGGFVVNNKFEDYFIQGKEYKDQKFQWQQSDNSSDTDVHIEDIIINVTASSGTIQNVRYDDNGGEYWVYYDYIAGNEAGPVTFNFHSEWTEVSNVTDLPVQTLASNWTETRNVLKEITLPTVDISQHNKGEWVSLFTGTDVFENMAHDNRYSFLYKREDNRGYDEDRGFVDQRVEYVERDAVWSQKTNSDALKIQDNNNDWVEFKIKQVVDNNPYSIESAISPVKVDANDSRTVQVKLDSDLKDETDRTTVIRFLVKDWNQKFDKIVNIPVHLIK